VNLLLHHAHDWDLTPQEAEATQIYLRSFLKIHALPDRQIQRVGGVDVSYRVGRALAAAVVIDYVSLEMIEHSLVETAVSFPYIPGLLSFRECPAILAALGALSDLPDVLLVDGHGMAHPRRFGVACHVGVLLDLPTIGCAKSLLVGAHGPLGEERGSTSDLMLEGEVAGAALRTRPGVRPVYISAGHRIDLESAVRIVLACSRGYRMPQPCRFAHRLAGEGFL